MTNKQIVDAQRILRRLEGTPVRFTNSNGQVFWQITYDDDTYRSLLNVVGSVASIPIKEVHTNTQPTVRDTAFESVTDYHRDKI